MHIFGYSRKIFKTKSTISDNMALFKKEEPKQTGTPTDKVLDLRQKGMSDNQIVKQMQGENFSSEDIFNALSQADIKKENSPNNIPPPMPKPEAPQFQQSQMIPQEPEMPKEDQYNAPFPQQPETLDVDKIEEIAESIIDEKWDELVKNVNKIIDWKTEIESKISELEEKNSHLQDNFDKLHKSILGKIEDYDKTLLNVGAELKAMNEIFQKILPTFTENVQTLQRVTQKLSKTKKK